MAFCPFLEMVPLPLFSLRWTLADAENHISATVKELRSQDLSSTDPSVSLLEPGASANPPTVTGIMRAVSTADVAEALAKAHGVTAPIAGLVRGLDGRYHAVVR